MSGLPRPKVEVVELDERARRVLARRHPEIAGTRNVLLLAVADDIRGRIVEMLNAVAQAVNDGEQAEFQRMVDDAATVVEIPQPDFVKEARRQAQLRARILSDFGAVKATDLAEFGGSTAGNRSQLSYRWRKQRRVFSVMYKGVAWYLGFQFDSSGQPLPVIATVMTEFETWDEWDIATWFVRPNGLLDRLRPVDLLGDAPQAVADAARADAARRDIHRPKRLAAKPESPSRRTR